MENNGRRLAGLVVVAWLTTLIGAPSVHADPIPGTGSITIVKAAEADPGVGGNPNTPFSFNGPLGTFVLDNNEADPTFESSTTFDGLEAGTYDFTENLGNYWDLTAIVCDSPAATPDLANARVSIALEIDTHVTCTFTNTERLHGSITIVKDVNADPGAGGNPNTAFSFGGPLGTFILDNNEADATFASSTTFDGLEAGTYDFSEGFSNYWDLTSIVCSNGAIPDLDNGQVSVDLTAGEDVTCTFTNTERLHGSITIVKDVNADPGAGGNPNTAFSFGGPLGTFILDNNEADATFASSTTFDGLEAGTYDFSEGFSNYWDLTSIVCSNGAIPDLDNGQVSVDLTAGEDVTCTFTNTERLHGSITIVKATTPHSNQTFLFNGPLGSFILDNNEADATFASSRTFDGLEAGTYQFNEDFAAGFDLVSLQCDSPNASPDVGNHQVTVNLTAGEDVTCTFTNGDQQPPQPASLTIIKDTLPNAAQDFSFTTSGDGISDFSLDDDTNPTLPDRITFTDLTPGQFSITEAAAVGYSLTGLVCTTPNYGVSADTIFVTLGSGQNVTCTFTNTELGSITVVKQAIADDPADQGQDFNFFTSLGNFDLDDDADPTLPNSMTFGDLLPAQYDVVESISVPGWSLTGLTCSPGGSADLVNARAAITLLAGADVTCTFTNAQSLASLTIVKDSLPDGPQDFGFTTAGDGLSSFALDDDNNPTLADRITFTDLTPGSFSITEGAVPGFAITGLVCDTQNYGVTVDTIFVNLSSGEDVTCTFTNTEYGSVTVVKDAVADTAADQGQDFSFFFSALGNFALDDDTDPTLSNSQTFGDLLPGQYTVIESLGLPGWALTGLTCSPGATVDLANGVATIDLVAGADVTCTFTNSQSQASLTIVKDTLPNSGQDFSFTATGDRLSDFTLDDDTDPTLSDRITFTDLTPGFFSVTEGAVPGFAITGLVCDTPNYGAGGDTIFVTLNSGEDVTCTFTNTELGSITVAKHAVADTPADQGQDFTFFTSLGNFALDDDTDPTLSNTQTFGDLLPGLYNVGENIGLPGWSLTGLTCGLGATVDLNTGVATIDLVAGADVTCTFTNTQSQASLTIVKDTLPNGGQDFAYTTTGDRLSDFTLDDDTDPTLPNSVTFTDLTPGQFSIAEAGVPGYAITGLTCDTPNYGATADTIFVNLNSGDNVTCTFTNTEYGSITLVKNAVADTPADQGQDFTFFTSFGNFALDDDTDPTLPNSQTFGDLLPGQYTLFEGLGLPGWALTGLTCGPGGTVDLDTGVANVDLVAGADVTCTYTNTQSQASLTIVKDTLPNSGQDFSFTTTGDRLSDFTLDDDTDPTLSDRITFTDLTPGQFSIAEAAVPGYAITGLTCDTPNYGATADTIFVNLNSGDNVTCTFTNTEYGSITLVKNAVADTPADQGQDFTFFTSFGNFALDDDTDPTLPNSQTFGDLLPGQYTLFEGLGLPGWALTGLTCGPGGTVDLDTGVANVDLVAGADVTCTYTNTQSQASLTIVKDTLPNAPQDFAFTTTGDGLTDFSLDDDTDPTLSDRITFTDLTPGSFSVTEAAVPGYAITGLVCDTPNYGASADAIFVTLNSGDNVTCTFTNTELGSVTITKNAVADAPADQGQDFNFSGAFGSFALDDDTDPTLSDTTTFSDLLPGQYTVFEALGLPGWALTGLTCTPGGTADLASGFATIDLVAGAEVTCTFTNTQSQASLTIVKDTSPNGPQDFAFTTTGDGLSDFSLDDDTDPTLSNSVTFTDLTPGQFSITETAVPGWAITGLVCDTTNYGAGADTIFVTLNSGEHITCTFTNTEYGSITVVKNAVADTPADQGQDFTFFTSLGTVVLDDDTDPTLSDTATFGEVLPGQYSVVESLGLPGWALTGLTCTPGGATDLASGVATIDLVAGADVTCTYTNTQSQATLTIVKDTLPNGPQDFAFTTTGDGLSDFSLDDDTDATLANSVTFTDLTPGQFAITEAADPGYALTSLTCDTPNHGASADTIFVTLNSGEHVTCTFTNTEYGSITIVKHAIADTPADQGQDFTFFSTWGTFELDDDTDPTLPSSSTIPLLPGEYDVFESLSLPGWALTGLTCTPGANVDITTGHAHVELVAGADVTCTYTNTQSQATLRIVKDTLPNGPQDFAFTTTGDGMSDFSLDDDTDPTLSNVATFTDLTPGSFSVTEAAVPGFAITGLVCDTPNYGANADMIFVTLNSGDNVTCTFTNTAFGSVTVVKDAVADTPADQGQDFSFFGSFGFFALDDDTDATLANNQSFDELLPGQYTVFEALGLPGWALSQLSCTPGGTVDLASGTATVDLVAGADVTCTFTNTQSQASLTIVKDALPNGPQDFAFAATGDRLSDFTLDDDTDPTLANTVTFTDLTPGQFSITEAAVPGFALTGLTCDTPNYGANVDTIFVTLNSGDNVTCRFTNTELGSITVVKDTIADTAADQGQDFTFFLSSLGNFALDDDTDPTLSNTQTFGELLPGQYTVFESLGLPGWALTGLSCTAGATDLNTGVATLDLVAGADVTCTFTNTQSQATLTIVKDTLPNSPRDFSFTTTGDRLSDFTLDDDTDPTLSNSLTFTDLTPGQFSITEAAVPGYALTALTCDTPNFGANADTIFVTLNSGDNVTCTFTNTEYGTITIEKDAIADTSADQGQDFTFFTSFGTVVLDDDTDPTLANTQTFGDLLPGQYTVAENLGLPGWALTGLTCSPGATVDRDNGVATIDLIAGADVTCTFTNTQSQATLTIVKDTLPNGPQDFSFTTTGDRLSGFNLDDDTDLTLSNSVTFTALTPGQFSITEAAVPGYAITGLICDTPNYGANADTIVVTLNSGDDVTCTFTNTALGSVTIVKQAFADDPADQGQDFTFFGSFGSFALDDDTDSTLSSSQTFGNLAPGQYSVGEDQGLPGWELTGITCTQGGSVDLPRGAIINLVAGADVTCTFTNTQSLASLTIVKNAVPNGPQDFSFTTTGDGLSDFSLDDDSNPTLPNAMTFVGLTPGQFSVTELAQAGYALTNITCDSPNYSVSSDTVFVTLIADEEVTCTFTNTELGSVSITKHAVADAPADQGQDFSFSGSFGAFALDDDTDPTLSNTRTFGGLLPGQYSVAEDLGLPGWALTGITCTRGASVDFARGVIVNLVAGADVACTFTNTQTETQATLTIVKDTQPDGPQDFAFATTGAGLSPFSLDDDTDPTLPNAMTFTGLTPGAFTVTEAAQAGYALTGLICDTANYSAGSDSVALTLLAGDNVTCTFVNTELAANGSITILKDAVADPGPGGTPDQAFSFFGDLGSFTLDDNVDATFPNARTFLLAPGSYAVSEFATSGWDLTGLSCDSANTSPDVPTASVSITLAAGDAVTCTFTNTEQAHGSITVTKNASPDSEQDFSFFGPTGPFTLDDDADAALPNSMTFDGLVAGQYFVGEVLGTPNWDLTGITCTPGATVDLVQGVALVDLVAGADVTCTFTNTERTVDQGSITIIKDAVPNDGQDFAFTGSLGGFTLDDDADPAFSNVKTVTALDPDVYTVTETPIAGWRLTDITCSAGGTPDVAGGSVAITIAGGENVTCSFTNAKDATITIVKDSVPNDGQDFAFNGSFGSFTLDDDNDPLLSDRGAFTNLAPGQYTVSEILGTANWDLTAINCDGPNVSPDIANGTVTITIAGGENVTCTFTNTLDALGSITIVKDAEADPGVGGTPGQDFSFFGPLESFTLDDDNDPEFPNSYTVDGLTQGIYTFGEFLGTPNWDLTDITCTNGGATNLPNGYVDITLQPGEDITCTFTNVERAHGSITIVKDAQADPGVGGTPGQDFSFFGPFESFTLDDDNDPELPSSYFVDGLAEGIYTFGEFLGTANWDLTDITCTNGGATNLPNGYVDITLQPGEDITCTFTNVERLHGSITIVKDAQADPGVGGTPGQDFSFFGPFESFTLDDDNDPELPSSYFVDGLAEGIYTFGEFLGTANWDLTDITCTNGGATNLPNGYVDITLQPGEDITCTFTNVERLHGSITIVKDSDPPLAEDFSFFGPFESFTLDDDNDPELPNSYFVDGVTEGTYTFGEFLGTPKWTLTNITCTSGGATNVPNGYVDITLQPGDDVTCTFTNTRELEADLSVEIELPSIAPGAPGTVELRVTNDGPTRAPDTIVTATIDGSLAVGTPPAGCTATPQVNLTTVVTCALGEVDRLTTTPPILIPVTLRTAPCTVPGTPADDALNGTAGNDVICGFGGADVINGLGGDDTIWGDTPAGFVTVVTNRATVTSSVPDPNPLNNSDTDNTPVTLGPGAGDTIDAGRGADTARGQEGNDTILGDVADAANVATGEPDALLDGGAGDDTIRGQGGNDTINGAGGADTALGGNGNDTVYGDVADAANAATGDADTLLDGGAGDDTIRGQGGNDTINGGAGADTALGGNGNDTIYGDIDNPTDTTTGTGDTLLDGGAGNDTIRGQGGNDTINGGGDADTALGGNGNDTIYGDIDNPTDTTTGTGDTLLDGGAGNDTIRGQGGNDNAINGSDGKDDLNGGAGNDNLDGGEADDTIDAGRGADIAVGGNGNDTIYGDIANAADTTTGDPDAALDGGPGNDAIYGQGGNDTINGGLGADTALGGSGTDTIYGDIDNPTDTTTGIGDTLLDGGADSDAVYGQGGNDVALDGGAGGDSVHGGDGNDPSVNGGGGGDTVTGGNGNDTVYGDVADAANIATGEPDGLLDGGPGKDKLYGQGGADTINGGPDNDTALGGNGNDFIYGDIVDAADVATGTGDSLLDGGPGTDTIRGQGGNDTINGGPDGDTVLGGNGDDTIYGDIESTTAPATGTGDTLLDGGAGDDTIYGQGGGDVVNGGPGRDTLRGEDGGDTVYGDVQNFAVLGTGDGDALLDGGADADALYGQGGNDVIRGQSGDDTAVGGTGDDDIFGGDGIDDLNGAAGNDDIAGGNGNDTLQGDVGTDTMHGDTGDDLIFGSDDADSLFGDAGNDDLRGGDGAEKVMRGGDGADVMNGGPGADTKMFGEAGADEMSGADGNDTVDGGDGNDELFGNEHDDTLRGGDGNDVMNGGPGADTMNGDAGADTMNGNDGNDELAGGDGDDSVFGGEGNDRQSGNDGNDTLGGDAGDDLLHGNAGNDLLAGGDGVDEVRGDAGNDELHGGSAPGTSLNKLYGGSGSDCASFGPDDASGIEKFGVCP